ncbi:SDR family NAD(P)-dependent oxidoreductase [Novosphingobium resinovorum]
MPASAWVLPAALQSGGDLVIWGRRQDKNEVAADELRGLGAKVFTQEVDVSDENRVIEAFAQAVSTMGRVDGAIANAA